MQNSKRIQVDKEDRVDKFRHYKHLCNHLVFQHSHNKFLGMDRDK